MELTRLTNPDTIFLKLSDEPALCDELKQLRVQYVDVLGGHVVLDFSRATDIGRDSLDSLIDVTNRCINSSRRLILCNVIPKVKAVFLSMQLHEVFEISCKRNPEDIFSELQEVP